MAHETVSHTQETSAASETTADLSVPPKPDVETPPALVEFMCTGWATRGSAVTPLADIAAFAARRQALSARFPGATLVIPAGDERVRSNDTHYRFRPASDFYYLTGCCEPGAVLLLAPTEVGHRVELFVEPGGRDDATFFTDRIKGELWVGPWLGVSGSRTRYGIEGCRSLRELKDVLTALDTSSPPPIRVLRGHAAGIDAAIAADSGDAELATALGEMRLIKDAVEVGEIEQAIASTHRGLCDIIAALPLATSERVIEGTFFLRARTEGNDVGYGTIAAAGANACVLHWTHNNGPIRAGELLLLDAGVERETLYTADITRTLPISGRFSPEQRSVYALVYRAQQAAMAVVKPGVDFMAPNRVAMRILAEGLQALGVLKVPLEEALSDEKRLYKRYTLHNISHMLGLDVHDCAKARQEAYKHGKLREGMVLTIEPGLYFQADDLTVPEALRGIGVRIEDDVLVTAVGCRNLSAAIPAAPDAVEAWMAEIWARRSSAGAG